MNWITDSIAIGNFLDAQDADLLRVEAIGSILGLTTALDQHEAEQLGVRFIRVIPLDDGPGNSVAQFAAALEALSDLAQNAPPVLVHCHMGRSRSVAIVAAYLMATQGLDADAALALIATKREIALSPALEQFLRER